MNHHDSLMISFFLGLLRLIGPLEVLDVGVVLVPLAVAVVVVVVVVDVVVVVVVMLVSGGSTSTLCGTSPASRNTFQLHSINIYMTYTMIVSNNGNPINGSHILNIVSSGRNDDVKLLHVCNINVSVRDCVWA